MLIENFRFLEPAGTAFGEPALFESILPNENSEGLGSMELLLLFDPSASGLSPSLEIGM
jgi:hypothetical protein